MDSHAYGGDGGAYEEAVAEAGDFDALRAAIDEFGGIVGDKAVDTPVGLKEQVAAAEDLTRDTDVSPESYENRFARAVASSESLQYIPTTHGIRDKVADLVEAEGYAVDDHNRVVEPDRATALQE